MVESINPANLMGFALDVAHWAARDIDSLDPELNEVLRTIGNFMPKEESYMNDVVMPICKACVDVVKAIFSTPANQAEPETTDITDETEKEVVDNGE